MNFKTVLLIFICLITSLSFSQAWKTDPYEPVGEIAFPLDEGRHATESVEWWYTSGHFTGDTSTKEYSFMLTYFYYPQTFGIFSFDGFRILNITDEATGTFYQDTQPVNYSTMSEIDLNIETTLVSGTEFLRNKLDVSNDRLPFQYELSASSLISNISFDLETIKRPLIVGGDGLFDQGLANYTYYYSQTKNTLTGSFTLNGNTENVTGTAWIDRQYGNFNPFSGEKYEWFSLQLDNGTDLNLWNIFTANREIPNNAKYKILSAYVDEAQNTQYTINDFEIERLEYFFTPDNLKSYSKKWRLTSVSKNIDLVITARHESTEVNITQLSFRFFEGSLDVTGTINGISVTGVGFGELLHNYEHPDVDMANPTGGFYNTSTPITWTLNNPDDGRPLKYDLEYSIDNKSTFLPIATGLTTPSYTWDGSGINNGNDVWFKVKAYSVDNTLSSEIISSSSSSVTLSKLDFKDKMVMFYPNPVEEELTVVLQESLIDGVIEIIDINGRTILKTKVGSNNIYKIDTQLLIQGVYFFKISSNGVTSVEKIIKK